MTISIRNQGYCHCCQSETVFTANRPWLRAHYRCAQCNSNPRERHLAHILDTVFPGWEGGEVHESSPSSQHLARRCARYSRSFFYPNVPLGSQHNGERCENLEALTFADASFDTVVTLDVFEHVFDPAQAAREVLRVLKPGGAHVFTTPKHADLAKTRQRADLSTQGEVTHLLPPEYHGNPISDKGALVTWDFGQDFEALLGAWTGVAPTTYVTRDRQLGLDGAFLDVFVMRKP